MIGQRLFFAAASLFLLSLPAFPEPATPTSEKIDQSIRNLGSSAFATRQRAAEDLARIGQPALAALKAALASPDEEVRRRADSITRVIEGRLQNEAAIRPTKIRLKYDGTPLNEVIADLNRKTSLNFALVPNLTVAEVTQPVTLDTGEVPFWEAVEKFLAAANLTENIEKPAVDPQAQSGINGGGRRRVVQVPQQAAPDNRVLLGKAAAAPLPADTSSLVRIKMLPATAEGAGVTKGTNQIHFMLDVTPSPSVNWRGVATVDIHRAVDERGTNLEQCYVNSDAGNKLANMNDPFNGGQVFVGNGQMIINGNIVFNDVAAAAAANPRRTRFTLLGKENSHKTLKELTGVVCGRLRSAPTTLLTVDNLLTVSLKDSHDAGEHQIRFTERRTEKAGYLYVRFTVTSPVENELMTPWMVGRGGVIIRGGGFVVGNEQVNGNDQPTFTFQDATGKTIANSDLNMTDQSGGDEVVVTEYLAVIPTRAYKADSIKFVVGGRKSVTATIPFTLKNVPLP